MATARRRLYRKREEKEKGKEEKRTKRRQGRRIDGLIISSLFTDKCSISVCLLFEFFSRILFPRSHFTPFGHSKSCFIDMSASAHGSLLRTSLVVYEGTNRTRRICNIRMWIFEMEKVTFKGTIITYNRFLIINDKKDVTLLIIKIRLVIIVSNELISYVQGR